MILRKKWKSKIAVPTYWINCNHNYHHMELWFIMIKITNWNSTSEIARQKLWLTILSQLLHMPTTWPSKTKRATNKYILNLDFKISYTNPIWIIKMHPSSKIMPSKQLSNWGRFIETRTGNALLKNNNKPGRKVINLVP